MYISCVMYILSTDDTKPLKLPKVTTRPYQYVVSVDAIDKQALEVAKHLWSNLPGKVRVVSRGMLYFDLVAKTYSEMFTPLVLDETQPIVNVHVGTPPQPQVMLDADGTKTTYPVDPALKVVQDFGHAFALIDAERQRVLDEKEKAFMDKFWYGVRIGICVVLAGLAIWTVCR